MITKSWMSRVDDRLFEICRMRVSKIPPQDWISKKKAGMTAREAADSVIREWYNKMLDTNVTSTIHNVIPLNEQGFTTSIYPIRVDRLD